MTSKTSRVDRFWSKVRPETDDSCWGWTGSIDRYGYGVISVHRRMVLAHRMSWELHYGQIPDGMCVLHKCDNRKCVKPTHLFTGTHADNVKDKVMKGRQAMKDGHGSAKLTSDGVASIRGMISCGEKMSRIANAFGVSERAIRFIKDGVTWKESKAQPEESHA